MGREDTGRYLCVADNGVGKQASATISLTVLRKLDSSFLTIIIIFTIFVIVIGIVINSESISKHKGNQVSEIISLSLTVLHKLDSSFTSLSSFSMPFYFVQYLDLEKTPPEGQPTQLQSYSYAKA